MSIGYTSPQFVPGSLFFVPGAYLSFNNNATAANAIITVTGDGNVCRRESPGLERIPLLGSI